jgi:hypothetical protein
MPEVTHLAEKLTPTSEAEAYTTPR